MNEADHAQLLRRSFQLCTNHLAGPLVAYDRVVRELDEEGRCKVGTMIVEESRRTQAALSTSDPRWRREELVIQFATALFCLDRG